MTLKFEKLNALPGFPLGYRTTIPHLGVVDLIVVGTGDVAIDLQLGEGHVNLAYRATMDLAKELCEKIAENRFACHGLRKALERCQAKKRA